MKVKFSAGSLIAASLIGLGSVAAFSNPSYAESKFFCGTWEGKPTTMVNTSRGEEPMIAWNQVNTVGNLSAQQRCEIISQRFQSHYQNGVFKFVARKNFNGHPVICAVAQTGQQCNKNNVLITLQKGVNANQVLTQIRDFRRGASSTTLQLSEGTLFYDNGELYMDVNKMLEETDQQSRF